MINRRIVLGIFAVLMTLMSCKKESKIIDEGLITFKPNNYFPMSVGSYWVYEYRGYTPEGEEAGSPRTDTLMIIGDTLIDTHQFFIFKNDYPIENIRTYRRDSAGYIINQKGAIMLPPYPIPDKKYSEISSTDPETDEVVSRYWIEFPTTTSAITPAGVFGAIQRTDFHYRKMGDFEVSLSDTMLFANIGMVQTGFSFMSGYRNVGKLLSYHLE